MAQQPSFDVYQLEYALVRARNRLYFRLGPKDERDARKIFVAGHPRTGTGTLHRIFVDNGLDSAHTPGTWKTARHECFSDRGNYQPLALLDDYSRNGRFIMNTRPAWSYLKSRMNQTVKKRTNKGLVQPRFTARNVANEILRRNNHFLDFVRHFHDKDNFVVVNIERPGAFDFVCEQLDLQREKEIWHNKGRPRLAEETLGLIDAGFRLLGIEDERTNPFIIPQLLDEPERRMVEGFLSDHAERIRL